MSDKRKQSLYISEAQLQKLQAIADRLDRSISWLVQKALEMSLTDIERKFAPRGEK